ncbi:MAG: tRNA pseudouridine(38-40) synthase TruA [Lachnospiraceae bacterium]|jgi:tRNA pseudouridine38-40 synthase|nr:tRNA pseudouridine(38-40) synthase TruA [Lachnospiraceae bacterium]
MLTVAYDGTGYHGWQAQKNAPTIEGELNRALSELTRENVVVIGASRTDAGVHALGNVAVFDSETPIPAEKIAFAINRCLPEDIRVVASEEVAPDFHPRHVECRKTYEYHILNAPIALPTMRLYHHFTHIRLDVEKMNEAAQYLVGEHDFTSFCAVGAVVESKVRTIFEASVTSGGRMWTSAPTADIIASAPAVGAVVNRPFHTNITITLTGNAFLYHMVRIIAGTLMEVGAGRYPPEAVAGIIAARDRCAAGPTAPAHGLTLAKISYIC